MGMVVPEILALVSIDRTWELTSGVLWFIVEIWNRDKIFCSKQIFHLNVFGYVKLSSEMNMLWIKVYGVIDINYCTDMSPDPIAFVSISHLAACYTLPEWQMPQFFNIISFLLWLLH